MAIGQDLLNVPFGDMVLQLGMAVAESQTKMDSNSIEILRAMSGDQVELPKIDDPNQSIKLPVLALGFTPTFYQFSESTIEVKIAITMVRSTEFKAGIKGKLGWGPFSASVDASYSRKYEYKAEGSSLLRTKLVPVPPPQTLQDYMAALIQKMIDQSNLVTVSVSPSPAGGAAG